MKAKKTITSPLTESGIHSRLNHKSFLQFLLQTKRFKKRKLFRSVDKENQNTLFLLGIEGYTLEPSISLAPEFLAYSFHLSGISTKLLLYILFFEMDNHSFCFHIVPPLIQQFQKFCFLFEEKTFSDVAFTQALKNLERAHALLRLDKEVMMINPMIIGGLSRLKRKRLIKEYSLHLAEKGFDASTDFYPIYRL